MTRSLQNRAFIYSTTRCTASKLYSRARWRFCAGALLFARGSMVPGSIPGDGAPASNHELPGSIPGGRFPGLPAAPHHLLALPNWSRVPSSMPSWPWGAVSAELGDYVHQTRSQAQPLNRGLSRSALSICIYLTMPRLFGQGPQPRVAILSLIHI